jgi:RNA polymerase sigma-70 factor (ECF subfamily)
MTLTVVLRDEYVTSVTDAESLFAQYHDRLLRYLSRAAGEREVARDLIQEVFLRVSRTAIPTAPENQLAGWLFKIARNVALDHHRQRRHRPETDLNSAPEAATNAQQEMVLALKQALATLTDLDRDVFLLRELSGLSREEIATACDLTPDAVRSRLHRTRLELRAVLAAPIRELRHDHIRHLGNTRALR